MATTPVNLIDAISATGLQRARANTSIVRIGVIDESPAGGEVAVMIGGSPVRCQWLNGYYPIVGDTVAVLVTRDAWLVIGSVNDKPAASPAGLLPVPGTYGSGWGPGPYADYGWRLGPLAWRRLSVTRTGGAIACPSSGYISPAQLLFTPTDLAMWGSVTNACAITYYGAPMGWGYTGTSGGAYLTYIMSSYISIPTGADFTAMMVYMVDNP
jgi:hypothetical protein